MKAKPKIISASRRTDIPAFYAEWFINRVKAGYCLVPNPYNRKQVSRVSLAQNDIAVMGNYAGKPDTTIKGAPITLMRLGTSNDSGKTLLESDASIEGNTHVGAEFSRILSEVDIDWEQILSQFVGDTVAYQAGQLVAGSAKWLKERQQTLQSETSEYLTEESQLTPAEAEINHYLDQVDELRMSVDRLEARINHYIKDATDNQ